MKKPVLPLRRFSRHILPTENSNNTDQIHWDLVGVFIESMHNTVKNAKDVFCMNNNKLKMTRQLRLEYYNRYLREKGLITEKEYRFMLSKIQSRYK